MTKREIMLYTRIGKRFGVELKTREAADHFLKEVAPTLGADAMLDIMRYMIESANESLNVIESQIFSEPVITEGVTIN